MAEPGATHIPYAEVDVTIVHLAGSSTELWSFRCTYPPCPVDVLTFGAQDVLAGGEALMSRDKRENGMRLSRFCNSATPLHHEKMESSALIHPNAPAGTLLDPATALQVMFTRHRLLVPLCWRFQHAPHPSSGFLNPHDASALLLWTCRRWKSG